MFCDLYGSALTWGDMFLCYLYTIFGGDFTIFAIAIIAVFVIFAYKFLISPTLGLALAWPIIYYLHVWSGQTNYTLQVLLILTTIAIGLKVFTAALARFKQ